MVISWFYWNSWEVWVCSLDQDRIANPKPYCRFLRLAVDGQSIEHCDETGRHSSVSLTFFIFFFFFFFFPFLILILIL